LSPEVLAGGRYTVERTLGGGGMAVVYLAQDGELDRPVAIKILAGHVLGDKEFRARFVREARMAARLSHPNVVSIYDTGEEEGRPFIVMEYVEGETLADVVARRGRVPPADVVDLALQVCAGLEHAHRAGLVHRDVKPQNLLVRGLDGVVKVADFGIARSAEATTQLTQVGTVLGTAAYLAPEQATGEEVSAKTDLYSLGAVLYELLTGRAPYRFESLVALAFKQREQAVDPVREHAPEVPEPLEDVVMRCLARNPAYRPESAGALARELAAAAPEPPTRPLPAAGEAQTAPLRQPRPARRRDRRLWLVAAAAAAVVAIVAGLALAARDDPSPASPTTPAEPASREEKARDLADWLRENRE
jgi:eukaryotic-like serine/threonine-protein kinase